MVGINKTIPPPTVEQIDRMADDELDRFLRKMECEATETPYFTVKLQFYLKRSGMTREDLEEKSKVSIRTIQKLLHNEDYTPKLQTILAIAFALGLLPYEIYDLLRAKGYVLTNTRAHELYHFLIDTAYTQDIDIDQCNKILRRLNIAELKAV